MLGAITQYSYCFISYIQAGSIVPYAEHESGYSEFIALTVFKTITCLCMQHVECHAKTSAFLNTLTKGLKGISKNAGY